MLFVKVSKCLTIVIFFPGCFSFFLDWWKPRQVGVWLLGCQDTLPIPNWASKLWAAVLSAPAFSRPRWMLWTSQLPPGCRAFCFKRIFMQLSFYGCFHFWGAEWELSLLVSQSWETQPCPWPGFSACEGEGENYLFIHSMSIYSILS